VARIHAHFAHVPATIAMYAARQLRVPFSFTGHANDLFRERTLLREKLDRADRVVCISRWHREFYQETALIPDTRAPVIRCGVSTSEFAPHPGEQDPRVVLAVGRLVEKKGFHVLVKAIALLKGAGVPVRCRIVGDGVQHDQLASMIVDLGVADRVELLGARSNEDVRELMQSSGLFVLPCVEDSQGDRDGIPVVLMEAMASGLCVVSGHLPAIAELVENGQTGVMVPPGDVDELADAIETLVREPARAGVLGAAGRRRVREEFSQQVNIARLLDAFGIEARPEAAPRAGSLAFEPAPGAEHEEPMRKRA
jgi:glycosyltransferase involved in cell wall biosynthesis